MSSVTDTVRMSHTQDPHTSKDAAEKASKGTKRALLYGAILSLLEKYPMTPGELLAEYNDRRNLAPGWLPEADLYDIRRRMTELEHDHGRIESVVESPGRFERRAGQRVMRLVTS